eukprot:4429390-Pleurochrysis_carterae.AAC.1
MFYLQCLPLIACAYMRIACRHHIRARAQQSLGVPRPFMVRALAGLRRPAADVHVRQHVVLLDGGDRIARCEAKAHLTPQRLLTPGCERVDVL